jgi:Glycosyl hydrolases family 16/CARDB
MALRSLQSVNTASVLCYTSTSFRRSVRSNLRLLLFMGTMLTSASCFAASDVIVTSLSYNSATGLFTSVVKNQGADPTPAGVSVGVAYSVDGNKVSCGWVTGPLNPGASVTIGSGCGTFTIPNGTHTITAFADDVNRFAESNETNNTLSQPITIGSSLPPPSLNGATITGTGALYDSGGNAWTLSGGVVYENGQKAAYSASVVELAYFNGRIYQENSWGGWWDWVNNTWAAATSPLTAVNGACGAANGTTVGAAPTTNLCGAGTASAVSGAGPWNWTCAGGNGGATASCSAQKTAAANAPSANGATITGAGALYDSGLNKWTLSGGVVYENGQTAAYSAGVVELAYVNGLIYQENSWGGWWDWNGSGWLYTQNPLGTNHVYVPIDSSYNLIFDDEFNGTSLDQSKWTPNWFGATASSITPPGTGVETAAYDPAQITVSGGYLHLTAISNPITINGANYPYRTGAMNTNSGKFQFTYGYAEARIYVPAAGTQIANWPAWWMDGQNWPTDGEIDVLEGLAGTAQWHFHNPSGAPGGDAGPGYTGWHVFAMLWQPGSVTYYYDGVQVGRLTSGITASPMYLVLGNQVGQWGGPLLIPADMMVDYVHVYSKTIQAVTPQLNYHGPGDAG